MNSSLWHYNTFDIHSVVLQIAKSFIVIEGWVCMWYLFAADLDKVQLGTLLVNTKFIQFIFKLNVSKVYKRPWCGIHTLSRSLVESIPHLSIMTVALLVRLVWSSEWFVVLKGTVVGLLFTITRTVITQNQLLIHLDSKHLQWLNLTCLSHLSDLFASLITKLNQLVLFIVSFLCSLIYATNCSRSFHID